MKNSNIKLHINIMKIFKYLIFVFVFFVIQLQLAELKIYAETTIKPGPTQNFYFSYKNRYVMAHTPYETTYLVGNTVYSSTEEVVITYYIPKGYTSTLSIDDGFWTATSYTADKIFEAKGTKQVKTGKTVTFSANLAAGIFDSKSSGKVKITYKLDTTNPTITLKDDNLFSYQKKHVITVTSTDTESGIRKTEYCWSTTSSSCSSWNTLSGTSIEKSDGTGVSYLHVRTTDNVGNTASTYMAVYMDNTEPTITYDPPISAVTSWKKVHTVSNVKVSDSRSGVKAKYYCWSTSSSECKGYEWTQFYGTTISETNNILDGIYYLLIKAEDNAGNVKQVVVTTVGESNTDQGSTGSGSSGGSSGIGGGSGKKFEQVMIFSMGTSSLEGIVQFRFDNTKPTLNVKVGNSDKGLSSRNWTNETDVTLKASDTHTDVVSATIQISIGINSTNYSETITVPLGAAFDLTSLTTKNGSYVATKIENGLYVKITITDAAGNSRVETMSLYVDNVAPTVDIITGVNKLGVQKTWLNLSDVILYEITIGDSNFKSMTYTNLSDKCEAVADTGTTKRNLTVRCKKGVASFKLEYEVVDSAGNKNINSASYGTNQSTFYFDTNGVILKDGNVEIGGTVLANGFFPSKSNTTKANLITYEVEEIELVDVEVVSEDTPVVVNDEEVKDIEVSIDEEEHKDLDSKVIELGNSEICVTNIKFSYANEELKKLFILNKKLNKFIVKK